MSTGLLPSPCRLSCAAPPASQELLVFNNAACIHHFRNGGPKGIPQGEDPPVALSIRMKYAYSCDPRCAWHLCSDLRMWWRFTIFFASQAVLNEKGEDRDAKYL